MVKAVEGVNVAFDVPVEARAEKILIERDTKITGELRKRGDRSELLAVLVVTFIIDVPEEFVPDYWTTNVTSDELAIERWFLRCRKSLVEARVSGEP